MLNTRGAGAGHAVAGGSVIAGQPALRATFAEGLEAESAGRIIPHLFTGKPVADACHLAACLIETTAAGLPTAAALS